jgi:predicted RecB family nuclease
MQINLDLRNHLITRLNQLQANANDLAHQLEHMVTEIREISKVIMTIPAVMSETQMQQIIDNIQQNGDIVFSTDFNRATALGFITHHIEDGSPVYTFESVHAEITVETAPIYQRLTEIYSADVKAIMDATGSTTVWFYVKPKPVPVVDDTHVVQQTTEQVAVEAVKTETTNVVVESQNVTDPVQINTADGGTSE